MSKPKVPIHVVGGIAYWSSEGDVDVVVVDEDNIKAGDSPVQLTRDWRHSRVAASIFLTGGLFELRS